MYLKSPALTIGKNIRLPLSIPRESEFRPRLMVARRQRQEWVDVWVSITKVEDRDS